MQFLSSHPSRADLLDFAEMLESNAGQASAAIHLHVSECERCAAEVERSRQTIQIAMRAEGLEPSREWRAQILLNARQLRGHGGVRARYRLNTSSGRGVAAVTALVFIASVSAIAVVQQSRLGRGGPQEFTGPSSAAVFSLDVLRQASLEERLLAPAVLSESSPATPWEASQHRAVQAWDAEIDEALAALESNPACARAATLVNTNRERLGETLKVLYVERNF